MAGTAVSPLVDSSGTWPPGRPRERCLPSGEETSEMRPSSAAENMWWPGCHEGETGNGRPGTAVGGHQAGGESESAPMGMGGWSGAPPDRARERHSRLDFFFGRRRR